MAGGQRQNSRPSWSQQSVPTATPELVTAWPHPAASHFLGGFMQIKLDGFLNKIPHVTPGWRGNSPRSEPLADVNNFILLEPLDFAVTSL